jgi:hypothetical protein
VDESSGVDSRESIRRIDVRRLYPIFLIAVSSLVSLIAFPLTNARVWERAQRVAGYLMVGAGVLGVVAVFLPLAFAVLTLAILGITASVIPLVYSYFVWKQETSR